MDVIPETRDWSPLVRAFRTGNQVELTVDYQTNGWYDDELGYYLYDYGHVELVFGGTEVMADAGGDDDGWLHVATTALVEAGTPRQASVLFRLDNIDPFGWTFDISVALLDSAGSLTGGDGIDMLFGSDGKDTLSGGAGADALEGGLGADRLDGGAGADIMAGGAGNDRYIVDDTGDRVDESAEGSGGRDRVESSISFLLGGELVSGRIEVLALTGSEAIDGIGNRFHNRLIGNSAANHLEGRGGKDVLIGGGGNDTLSGGDGADAFVFRDAPAEGTLDRILDFDPRVDMIRLHRAAMPELGEAAAPLWNSFVANAEGAATTEATRIIYETDTGLLRYDADGTGEIAAVAFARLNPGLAVGLSNFLVI